MDKIKQKMYLNCLKNNLGKVKENEDKIICYVEPEKIKKYEDKRWYHFVFNENKLNKPLHIIFDGIEFDSYKNIIIDSCDGISFKFQNCIFDGQIDIGYAESVHLEKNIYYHYTPFTRIDCFFKGNIKNLKIINDRFCMYELHSAVPHIFNLNLETLEIKNTNIMLPNCNGEINFRANKIDVVDSHIKTNNSIKFIADKVNLNNSKIESQTEVVIIGKYSGDLKEQLNTPRLNHNGINVTEKILGISKPKQLIKK